MKKKNHLEILKEGQRTWNQWRLQNPQELPDLRRADLSGAGIAKLHKK